MRALLVVVIAALAGCAPTPPSPDTASAVASSGSSADAGSHVGAQAKAFKAPPGWKVKIHDWEVVYCRKTSVLGTRFPTELCLTEDELKQELERNASARGEVDRAQRVCGTDCDPD